MRLWKKNAVSILGLTTVAVSAGLGIFLWTHRVELFEIPVAWREVLCMVEFTEDAREELEMVLAGGASQDGLDKAMLHLIRLQRPLTETARRFELIRMKTHEGRWAYVACFKVTREECEHILLDSEGRVFPCALGIYDSHHDHVGHSVYASEDEPYDVMSVWDASGTHGPAFQLSVDKRGFVPHGFLEYELQIPVYWDLCSFPGQYRKPSSGENTQHVEERIYGFLDGSDEPNLLRGLHLIDENGSAVARLAAPLLRHPSPTVRARAASVLGESGEHDDAVSLLLDDPSPRVRLTAFYAPRDREVDKRLALRLTRDPDPWVVAAAHRYLSGCDDRKLASASLAYLLQHRRALTWNLMASPPFRELSSAPAADALLSWLEDDLESALATQGIGEHIEDLECGLAEFRPEHLRHLKPRLLALYKKIPQLRDKRGILGALLKLEGLEAERILVDVLKDPSVEVAECILLPLLHRMSPLQSSEAIGAIQAIATASLRYNSYSTEALYALVLLAKWNVPGSKAQMRSALERRQEYVENLEYMISDELAPKDLKALIKNP